MQSDRELLELAARAAGYASWDFLAGEDGNLMNVYRDDGTHDVWWPLEDDGDIARLEAALEIDVSWMSRTVTSQHLSGHVLCSVSESFSDHGLDKAKARRCASVRVAAAIGEAME